MHTHVVIVLKHWDDASNLSAGLAYSCWPQISKSTRVFVQSCFPSACSNLYTSDYWKPSSMLSPIHNIPDVKVLDRVLRLVLQENFDRSCPCWLFWGMLGYKVGIHQSSALFVTFFFFLEHAGELRINILRRRKRGGGPPKCYSLSGPVTALLTYN